MTIELLGKHDVLELCQTLEVRPSKQRGQNFVIDPGTVRRIARSAAAHQVDCADDRAETFPLAGHTVLEIGPGLGSLTLALLELGARVLAVEIDPRLAGALPYTVQSHGGNLQCLQVLEFDALKLHSAQQLVQSSDWLPPSILAANLPYNIATPLLLHSLEALPEISRAVVMVQAEVAKRWVASKGEESYGAPSVKLAWWGRSRRVFRVGREVFYPIPNVDSAVVEFERCSDSFLENTIDSASLRTVTFDVISAAFAQRRKTLRQSLASWAGSAAIAEDLLRGAGIDPSLRAERLGVEEFARLGQYYLYKHPR